MGSQPRQHYSKVYYALNHFTRLNVDRGWKDVWMSGLEIDGWTGDGWMDERMDGWVDG